MRPEPVKAKSSPKEQKQAAMRRAIAAAMAKSKREIPHYYLSHRIDMSRPLTWLEEENLKRPITNRLVPAVLLLKATALAIREVPETNGFWIEDGFQPAKDIHLGMGISLRGGGLIAPAIHHADQKDLDELMVALRDLVKRSRSGGLRSSEMTDATVTVTNMGDLGVDLVYGVIYPPQVALIGFGKVMDQPWVENGMIGIRPVLTVTLAADHRASDGHRGGIFLSTIAKILQDPEAL
jgi:pyruvate dehydrogenase E2 component (dihydrolipoamide acetyltransferase)